MLYRRIDTRFFFVSNKIFVCFKSLLNFWKASSIFRYAVSFTRIGRWLAYQVKSSDWFQTLVSSLALIFTLKPLEKEWIILSRNSGQTILSHIYIFSLSRLLTISLSPPFPFVCPVSVNFTKTSFLIMYTRNVNCLFYDSMFQMSF